MPDPRPLEIVGVDDPNPNREPAPITLVGGIPDVALPDRLSDAALEDRFVVQAPAPTGVEATDTANLESAISDLGAGGGTVRLHPGTYRASGIALPDNVTLEGAGISATTIQRQTDEPVLVASGVTVSDHLVGLGARKLRLHGNDGATPIVDFSAVSRARFKEVMFFGVLGSWVKFTEVWDSRFDDCEFEWGCNSSATVNGVDLRSGSGWEYTNQIHFTNCRFESFRGTAVGNTGANTNEVFFTDCKFETGLQTATAPYVAFTSATDLRFYGAQFTAGGSGVLDALVALTSCNTVSGTVMVERAGGATVTLTKYVSVATTTGAKLDVIVYAGSPAPTGGAVVNWDGLNGDSCSFDVRAPGVISATVRAVSSSNSQGILNAGIVRHAPGGAAEPRYQMMRGDTSDTWNMGCLVADGSGSKWRLMHDSTVVFEITYGNVVQFMKPVRLARATSTVSTNSAITLDATTANVFHVSLSANVTATNLLYAATGQEVTVTYAQDATGGRTYAWPTNARFAGGSAPSATTANTATTVTFIWTGSLYLEQSRSVAIPTS